MEEVKVPDLTKDEIKMIIDVVNNISWKLKCERDDEVEELEQKKLELVSMDSVTLEEAKFRILEHQNQIYYIEARITGKDVYLRDLGYISKRLRTALL